MRLLLPLLLLGCSEVPQRIPPPGVVEVEEFGACDLGASDSIVEVDDGSRDTQVTFSHACTSPQDLDVFLDDPDDAFAIDVFGGSGAAAGDPVDVQIELLATEPGTYEAQLTAELSDSGDSITIEVIGTVYEE